MIDKKERATILEGFVKTAQGKAMLDLIEEKISDLGDIEKQTPETVVSNKMAVVKLKEIFRFILKTSPEQGDKNTNQYL